MNEQDIVKKMRADNFIKNNGIVLRAVNIGRTSYNRLEQLRSALEPDIDKAEFADCINYLAEAGFITLRHCTSKQAANLADNDIDELEAKVSAAGIRLLAGKTLDPCVKA